MVLHRAIEGARILRVPIGAAQDGLLKVSQSGAVALHSILSRTIANDTGSSNLGSEVVEVHCGFAERTQSGGQASCSSENRSGVYEGSCSAQFDGTSLGRRLIQKTVCLSTLGRLLGNNEGTQAARLKSGDANDHHSSGAAVVPQWPSCTTLVKGTFGSAVPPPWQAAWRRHYETRSGEPVTVAPTLNRRGKKLVKRREYKTDEGDEALLADEEGMAKVGLKGLRWMRELVNTPRRKQEGMLEDLYKEMHNPLSSNYLLWAAAAEGEAEDQRTLGKEERRLDPDADPDEQVERAFEMQIIDINRTNKATKGGRVMSMTAMVVVGNQDGVIGFGTGKALEPEIAVDKAYHRAVKNLLFVPRYRGHTIYHPVEVKYGQTKVRMWPAQDGTNIIASKILGGIADLAGIRNLKSKIIGSRHPQNVVKAVFKAFASIQTPTDIAQQFNRPVVEVRNMPFR